jgi:hypothetical protein
MREAGEEVESSLGGQWALASHMPAFYFVPSFVLVALLVSFTIPYSRSLSVSIVRQWPAWLAKC